MRHRFAVVCLFAFALTLAATPLFGQLTSGSLTGRVTG